MSNITLQILTGIPIPVPPVATPATYDGHGFPLTDGLGNTFVYPYASMTVGSCFILPAAPAFPPPQPVQAYTSGQVIAPIVPPPPQANYTLGAIPVYPTTFVVGGRTFTAFVNKSSGAQVWRTA